MFCFCAVNTWLVRTPQERGTSAVLRITTRTATVRTTLAYGTIATMATALFCVTTIGGTDIVHAGQFAIEECK